MKLAIGIALLLVGGLLTISACSSLSDAEKKNLSRSKQWDAKLGKFQNPNHALLDKQSEEMSFIGAVLELFTNDNENSPTKKLPLVKTDFTRFTQNSNEAMSVWFGHSSFLLRLDNKNVLVDPIFTNSVSPVPFTASRFQKLGITLDDLPDVDYIVISHDHYDHLEKESMKFFATRDVMYLVPLGIKKNLISWGVKPEKIKEFDWWENFKDGPLEFVFTPAQHASGRGLFDQFQTLWGSWAILGTNQRFYFSGDSGYADHFKTIGEKYGPFTAAFIESGQYNKSWSSVHLLPEQWGKVNRELKAESFIPVHWGMFSIAYHNWYDPPEYLIENSAKEGINLNIPMIGQIIDFDKALEPVKPWWREAMTDEAKKKYQETKPMSELQIKAKGFIDTVLKPKQGSDVVATPKDYGLDYEEVSFKTKDNVEIAAWLVHGAKEKIIVQAHPVTTNKSGHNLDTGALDKSKLARSFVDAGYSVLMFDARNHGRSGVSSKPFAIGTIDEGLDFLAAVDFIGQHPIYGNSKIGIAAECFGVGGVTAAYGMEDGLASRSQVKAITVAQPATWALLMRPAAGDAFVDEVNTQLERQGAASLDDFPRHGISKINVPTLVIQNQNDPSGTMPFVDEYFDAIKAKKDKWLLNAKADRGAAYGYIAQNPQKLIEWFNQHM